MSVALMGAVFRLSLPPGQKLTLLALANYANDRGLCWPTQTVLAHDISLSERQTRTVIHALEAAGWLAIVSVGNGRGKSSEYLLSTALITGKAEETSSIAASPIKGEKAEVCDVKEEIGAPKGGSPTSDQPPVLRTNHQRSTKDTREIAAFPAKAQRKYKPVDDPSYLDDQQSKHPLVNVREILANARNRPKTWGGYADQRRALGNYIRWAEEKVNSNGRTNTPARNPARSSRYATGDEVNESWDQWAAANKPEARNPAWKGSQQL